MSRAIFSSDLASQRREVCPGHSPVVSSQRGNVASVTISCADTTFCQAFHFDVQIGMSSCRHLGFVVPLVLFLPLLSLACDKVSGNLEKISVFSAKLSISTQKCIVAQKLAHSQSDPGSHH